jgi:hypothetical protein
MASKVTDARDNRVALLPDNVQHDAVIERLDVEEACERLIDARPKALAAKRAAVEAVALAGATRPWSNQMHVQKKARRASDDNADEDEAEDEEAVEQVDSEWRDLYAQLGANAKEIARRMAEEQLSDAERAAAEAELRHLAELRRKLEEMARLEAEARAAAEAQMQRERKRQAVIAKLRAMGTCEMGYAWHPVSGGFRCAGGSHWVPYGQVGVSEQEARSIFA